MAFSPGAQESNGGGFLGRRSRYRGSNSISEINVVPLVDVLLVLLVIFMLTAHVMEYGLEVDVPEVKQEKSTAEILPVITVSRSGNLYLNEKQVNINSIGDDIRKTFPKATDVYVRADRNVTWSPLAQVISELNTAKLKVKMVTKPVDNARSRK
jgi:biopolymer transport protein ExbD